jgi:Tfp pilus assembly protein PilZ
VPVETRVHRRLALHLPVTYRDGADLAASYIDSLSEGGVFIRTSRPLPIGTELVMEIEVKETDLEGPVRIRGKVV